MNKRRLLILALIALAIAVYANSLWNGFAYDDIWIIRHNDRVHQLHDLRSILFTPYWPSFGTELGLYRPFTILAFAIEWAIGNGAPWVFHLTNVLLHALACVLVFKLIERLATSRAAFIAAALFAVHSVHTEAVANVVGQSEIWASVGVLLACVIYVNRPDGTAINARTRIAILGLYAVSLCFKESAVVLPGLLVLLDFAQGRVQPTRDQLRRYVHDVAFVIVMFCLILAAYLTLRLSVLGNLTGTDNAPGLPFIHERYRVLNAFRAWPEFVRLLFFPADLSVDYAPGLILPVHSVTPMVALGMLLVLVSVVLMLLTPWRQRAGLMTGWFLLTILPVSNFFFPIGVLIAERTLYLPSLAVCLFAGVIADEGLRAAARETRRLTLAVVCLAVVALGYRTVIRNPDWDSLLAVWNGLARDHPESYRTQWLNALGEWSKKDTVFAEKYFQLAEKIWPRDSQLFVDVGNFYIGQKNYSKAIEYLERSRNMTPFVPRTWELLAYAYLYGGQPQNALRAALHANTLESSHAAVNYAVAAGAYDKLQRYDDAAGAYLAAARAKDGDLWLNWAMRARSLASAGRKQMALSAVDVAANRTRSSPALLKVVDQLRGAIEKNCYPQGGTCDPLAGWAIASGETAKTGK